MSTAEDILNRVSIMTHTDLNEQQAEFALIPLNEPTMSLSDPGTGKSTAAGFKLILSELYYRLPAQKTLVMSFTNMATIALKNKHYDLCRDCGIRQNQHFRTLHSICTEILAENYSLLGMTSFATRNALSIEKRCLQMEELCEELDIKINHPSQIRNIILAIDSLNSSLVFDIDHMESKHCFKKAGLSYKDFNYIRSQLYLQSKILGCIPRGETTLYALEILEQFPAIINKFKLKYTYILVDEFQDMSLLQLRILKLLTDNLTVIGDIKQQIYAFNGACQEIVSKYREYYPNAKEVNLGRSYRCSKQITEFSKSILKYSDIPNLDNFQGIDMEDTSINIYNSPQYLDKIIQEISFDFADTTKYPRSYMFLFRNNRSAMPVAEKLYKLKIPFRVDKFKMLTELPIVNDICALCDLIKSPNTANKLGVLSRFIPEFKDCKNANVNPLYKIVNSTGVPFWEISYNYTDQEYATEFLSNVYEASLMLKSRKPFKDIFAILEPHFYESFFKRIEFYVDYTRDNTYTIVNELAKGMCYETMQYYENEKRNFINENIELNRGVRCYTCHNAKGLEADVVTIIDADDSLIPSQNHLKTMLNDNCVIDAAREVRNERFLMFVAVTRAKSHLNIFHNGELTKLLQGKPCYTALDTTFAGFKEQYSDVELFKVFANSVVIQC